MTYKKSLKIYLTFDKNVKLKNRNFSFCGKVGCSFSDFLHRKRTFLNIIIVVFVSLTPELRNSVW